MHKFSMALSIHMYMYCFGAHALGTQAPPIFLFVILLEKKFTKSLYWHTYAPMYC
jgi:hypothetical protein